MIIPNDRRISPYQTTLTVLALSVLFAGFPQSAWTAGVLVSWDPPLEGGAAGYKVYGGTHVQSFEWSKDTGNTNAFVVSNLVVGVTYYFAVAAYNHFQMEGDLSEPIAYTPPGTNRPPTAVNLSLSSAEDTPSAVQLGANDPDGDPLVFEIVQWPSHGTVLGVAPDLVYQPATHFYGSDSLTFRVSDGRLWSTPATVQWTVTPVNDPPIAIPTTAYIARRGTSSIQLQATDADQDLLAYRIVAHPTQGTLTGAPPKMSYRPNANWSGSDTFRFSVRDPSLASAEATVVIQMQPGDISTSGDDNLPDPDPPSSHPPGIPTVTLIGGTPQVRLQVPGSVWATVESQDLAGMDDDGPWESLATWLGSTDEPEVAIFDPMGTDTDRAYRLRLETVGGPWATSETWIRRWFRLDGSEPLFPYNALNSPVDRTQATFLEPGRPILSPPVEIETDFAKPPSSPPSDSPTIDGTLGIPGTAMVWSVVGGLGTELQLERANEAAAPTADPGDPGVAPPFPCVADLFGHAMDQGLTLKPGDRISIEDTRDGQRWSLVVDTDPLGNWGYYLEQVGVRQGPFTGADLPLGPWHRLDLEASPTGSIRFVVTGIRRR